MGINILILSLFFLTISSCSKKDNDTSASLVNNKWYLISIENVKTKELIRYPDSIPRKESILFSDTSSTLFFGGVCNGGKGEYHIGSNDSIAIFNIKTTKIYCSYMAWEEYFKDSLDDSYKYKIEGNQLTIFTKGELNYIFSLSK